MKELILIALLLLSTSCGHIIVEGDIISADCPPWQASQDFHVFIGEPTVPYRLVQTLVAVSDVGDYPDAEEIVRSAKRFASRNGGNGVIITPGTRTDGPKPSNQFTVIYVDNENAEQSEHQN